jgi:hypothetical protein
VILSSYGNPGFGNTPPARSSSIYWINSTQITLVSQYIIASYTRCNIWNGKQTDRRIISQLCLHMRRCHSVSYQMLYIHYRTCTTSPVRVYSPLKEKSKKSRTLFFHRVILVFPCQGALLLYSGDVFRFRTLLFEITDSHINVAFVRIPSSRRMETVWTS